MKPIKATILSLAAMGAAACVPSFALAQSSSDQSFAAEAASGGMAEVKLGQLAQQNGTSDAVKTFGKRMETDHTKANEQLKDAASQSNVTIPTDMNRSDQAIYEKLSKLSGDEFDKSYMQQMVKDHQKDIAEFKKEASSGQNPEIKQFAAKSLPTLESHLKMAQGMEKSGGMSSQPTATR